ncbi:MAG: hypothetical protein PVJ39_20280 [Gammaproteobacteria bacterium]|jgi:hypothetical protein
MSRWEVWKNIALALGIPLMTIAIWLSVFGATPKNDDHEMCDAIRTNMPSLYETGMATNKEMRTICCQFHEHEQCN